VIHIAASFFTSFAITYFAIPSVLNVARIRKLFDIPDGRKIHKATIPALGGVAIFSAVFFSMLFWTEATNFAHLRWIVLALVITFLLGLKDDIVSIDPYKKLIGQIAAAALLAVWGNIRIENFHGLMGITELPFAVSVTLTIFTIIVIMNSFNLIDGIDGLAGSIGSIVAITFGLIFYMAGEISLAIIAFSLVGALLAFLRYNFSPASIFMGDGGSLVIGLILAILAIQFLNTTIYINAALNEGLLSTPPVALAILIIPLADTCRVFINRVLKGYSPFRADRNHIHHLLLKLGVSHTGSTLLLCVINVAFILFAFALSGSDVNLLLLLVGCVALILTQIPGKILSNRKLLLDKRKTVMHTKNAHSKTQEKRLV
jgi:UDP-GlcNAc:undecaprenyl-phosphate/decaprenyl-phosphate GlcNAc-1-phosphate transferase